MPSLQIYFLATIFMASSSASMSSLSNKSSVYADHADARGTLEKAILAMGGADRWTHHTSLHSEGVSSVRGKMSTISWDYDWTGTEYLFKRDATFDREKRSMSAKVSGNPQIISSNGSSRIHVTVAGDGSTELRELGTSGDIVQNYIAPGSSGKCKYTDANQQETRMRDEVCLNAASLILPTLALGRPKQAVHATEAQLGRPQPPT